MKIGLTLSGGGFRATVFHLGVLAYLAQLDKLQDISYLSTVSGGTITAALVYAGNNFKFPTPGEFSTVVDNAHRILTREDLEVGLIWRVLTAPLHILEPRGNYVSSLFRERWGIDKSLDEIPTTPLWLINATCYETGRNWRFEPTRMGDYVFGYTKNPKIPLSDAVAASCGFPGAIGALILDTAKFDWFTTQFGGNADGHSPTLVPQPNPKSSQVHLWDGGVYDILGLEPLFDPDDGWSRGIDFMIVSDVSGPPPYQEYHIGTDALLRIIVGVMMPQVRALRSQQVVERFKNHHDKGVLVEINQYCEKVLGKSFPDDITQQMIDQCLKKEDAEKLAGMETRIKRMTDDEFNCLFRHGYEVAGYTLFAHYNADHPFTSFEQAQKQKFAPA